MEHDDSNRAFVQAFLSRSVLTFEQARPILAAIFSIHEGKDVNPGDISLEDFTSYISAANDVLSPLDLEIRNTSHQIVGERYYALVNTTSDSLTQLATTHTADEIAYVKRLLDEMFEVNNTERKEAMCVAGREALNLVRAGRRDTQGNGQSQATFNLTAHDAEVLLSRLVAEGWLEKSPKGFYSLSPRALMELKNWLVETYNDPPEYQTDEADLVVDKIKFCNACKDIITVGQRCAKRTCPCRLHNICTQRAFRIQRAQTCPICNTAWDGQHFVGEKAITTSESYLRGKRRSGATTRDVEDEERNDQQQGRDT